MTEIQKTPEEIKLAIAAANHYIGMKRSRILQDGENPIRDAGINYRLGQVEALEWVLGSLEGNTVEDSVRIYSMIHKVPDLEGGQKNG